MTEGTQDAERDAIDTSATSNGQANATAASTVDVNATQDGVNGSTELAAPAPATRAKAAKKPAAPRARSAAAQAKAAAAAAAAAESAASAPVAAVADTPAPTPVAPVAEPVAPAPVAVSAPVTESAPVSAPAPVADPPPVTESPAVETITAAASNQGAPTQPRETEAGTTIENSPVSNTPNNSGGGDSENMQRNQNPLEGAPQLEGNMADNRQVRGGLRFRGREGRVEPRRPGNMPGGGDNRNFRGRDGRRGDGDANGHGGQQQGNRQGRLAQQGRDGGNRDGGNRDGGNRDGRDRDGGNRDFSNPEGLPRELGDGSAARGRNDYDLTSLEEMNLPELREIAKEFAITASTATKKTDLVFRILEAQAATSGNLFKKGHLEILPDGKGFLRTEGYLPGNEDVYVSQSQIKRFNLKTGDTVSGQVRAPKEMERYYGLLRVEAINGEAPEAMRTRKEFEKLTPVFPDEKFELETTQENITARIIDLVTPIGKGQRGLIVAPPKAGKTSLIKNIANSIMANHPDVYLIVLLIDERPEEVTDISRSVKGEVVASTFDELPDNHIRVADMVLEKAKRLVEMKRDVVILLDSITRLSRASNLTVTPSGRTMSGGLDPAAMYKPKRLFGAARNIEEGGSLTILATVLVDTGSRMDEYIFEELKGTGNLDLVLDRSLFDMRIFPSIDINKSGTRRDDLLLTKEDLAGVIHLRRTLSALDNDKAITLLIDRLKNTKTNVDFMQIVQKSSRNAPA